MNDVQKIRAELLRLDGKSPWEIAEILGIPAENIEAHTTRKYKKSIIGVEMSVFPELDAYMHRHGMTRMAFSELCGINYATMLDMLQGNFPPSKANIDKILAATGLTYEAAFREEK